MSDDPDAEAPWPSDYHVGPPKHLHAFGVISTVYNAFEDGMLRISAHHLEQLKVPRGVIEFFYSRLNERDRADAIQKVFTECERDPEVLGRLLNLLEHFQWCWEVRNMLAHAEHYPAMLGGKPGKWHLSKRFSKRNPNPSRGYLELGLPELREMADQIERGKKHCAGMQIYLRIRDIGVKNLPRGYAAYEHEPLPEVLEIPESLTLSPSPEIDP
jgi:hypothetical protein